MKSTPTQLANLDRDHDGSPGGSLPKAKPDDTGASAPTTASRSPAPASEGGQPDELALPPATVWNGPILGLPIVLVNPDGSRHVRGQNEFAAVVTRVNEDFSVSLTAFLPNRGPELHVNVRHRDEAKPSDRFFWRHLQEVVDVPAKSLQP